MIEDLALRSLIGAGEESNEVYHYKGAVDIHAGNVVQLQKRGLWHRRLGHPSSKVLSFLSGVSGVNVHSREHGVLESVCDVCLRAKQTRETFSTSINKADEIFYFDTL